MKRHIPVLLDEVKEWIPEWAEVIMDGTFGHGGHSEHFLSDWFAVVGVDKDQQMIDKGKKFLREGLSADQYKQLQIVQGSYADFSLIGEESGVEQFDYIFLDIGVNLDHFMEWDRGFSIKRDGPLDMRYDTTSGVSLAHWLRIANYPDLYEVFEQYGDFSEKYCEWLTRKMNNAQKDNPFTTTQQLRERAHDMGINDKKLAVIFQSLRIFINREFEELDAFLASFPAYLKDWWRCVVISYHSWEDRRVKKAFKRLEKAQKWHILTKSVVTPQRKEQQRNKASRSAKMRVFEC